MAERSTSSDKDESDEKKSQSKDQEKDDSSEEQSDKGPPKPPFYKRPVPMIILIALVVAGGIAGLLYWLHARHYESTDDAFIEGHVIAVSPRVSGIVQKVYIDDNYRVKVGDLLVELDPRDYEASLLQAQGNYASIEGKLKEAQAEIPVSQANIGQANAELVVAQANAQNARNDLNRFLSLDERARSKEQMDTQPIRRAERQLAAASARIGVASSDFYPKFSLTGSFGLDSSQIKHFLDWNSRYFALSPGVSWPIFDAGRIRDNVQVQKELTQQAATSYQSAVLTALREVDDALASYRTEQLRRAALNEAVDASRQAADLAHQQYEKGVIDFLEVLDTQRSLLQAEDVLAQSDSAISLDLVSLYKALGGGWDSRTVNQ